MSSKMDAFVKAATQHLGKVKGETEQFQTKELEALSIISSRLKDRKSTRLNSSHSGESRMPSSA